MLSLRKFSFGRLALLLVCVVPLGAWLLVKPVRVLAPTWVGVTCPVTSICVDDPARLAEAVKLHAEALAFVAATLQPVTDVPKVIFCSSQRCADAFGLGARSAVTLGTWGTVIGPRAWRDYYVRHEVIHQLQAEKLGVLRLLLRPSWWVEGMAYALSQDPRTPLAEPFEGYRRAFRAWHATHPGQGVWTSADAP